MIRSNVVLREIEKTSDTKLRDHLVSDFLKLAPVQLDEKVHGFSNELDQYGGHISNPLVSDVQDEQMVTELLNIIKQRKDAEHLTQAICNKCDIFLTLDGELLKKAEELTRKFGIRVLSPSQLAEEMGYATKL